MKILPIRNGIVNSPPHLLLLSNNLLDYDKTTHRIFDWSWHQRREWIEHLPWQGWPMDE